MMGVYRENFAEGFMLAFCISFVFWFGVIALVVVWL
jgi:hypothetical protein